MEPSRFRNHAMGTLVQAIADGKKCWSFIPNPLPHVINYTPRLASSLAAATGAIGELSGLARQISNPSLLLGPFMRREAVLSSRIEGTKTDIQELYAFEAQLNLPGLQQPDAGDSEEVLNYLRALQYGMRRLHEFPLSLRLIRELHHHLLQGVRGRDRDPGNFRSVQNWIPLPEGEKGNFVPPPVPEMLNALGALETYLHEEDEHSALVRIALVHYQFEVIHPFIDGNGRLGRLLIALLLVHWKLLPLPILYLSGFFEEHRQEYYERLWAASARGEITEWVDFFLRGAADQAIDTARRVGRLQSLQLLWKSKMTGKRATSLGPALVDLLFEMPVITIPEAMRHLGLSSYKSAQRQVERLVEAGILHSTGDREYNKVFIAWDILRLAGEHLRE